VNNYDGVRGTQQELGKYQQAAQRWLSKEAVLLKKAPPHPAFFSGVSQSFLPGLVWNNKPPELSLLSRYDYLSTLPSIHPPIHPSTYSASHWQQAENYNIFKLGRLLSTLFSKCKCAWEET
jgi:hypothetical protein